MSAKTFTRTELYSLPLLESVEDHRCGTTRSYYNILNTKFSKFLCFVMSSRIWIYQGLPPVELSYRPIVTELASRKTSY